MYRSVLVKVCVAVFFCVIVGNMWHIMCRSSGFVMVFGVCFSILVMWK